MNELAVAARNVRALVQTVAAPRARRAIHTLSVAFAALTAGSRTIPLSDNGELLKDLARRTRPCERISQKVH